MSDISAFVRRGTQSADREDINKLLAIITPIAFAEPEDLGVQERIILSNAIRERSTTVTSGEPDETSTDTRNRYAVNPHQKQIPSAVSSYPLSHTTTGTLTPMKTTNTKFGAGLTTDGSSYITISDDARLDDITTELTIAFWYYPKANAGGTELLVSRDNAWQIYTTSGDTLNFRVYDGSWKTPVTYDYTSDIDTWISVVATYKSSSSGQKLYINGSSQDTDSETGAISTGSDPVKILGDGTSDPASGTGMSWLVIGDWEWASGDVTNYNNGLTDTSSNESITTIDMAGDESVTHESTSGFCVSS